MTVNNQNINWYLIFQNKKLLKYLNQDELMEVSLSSKTVFKVLEPFIFSKFYLDERTVGLLDELPYINNICSGDSSKFINQVYFNCLIHEIGAQILIDYFYSLNFISFKSMEFDLTFINNLFNGLEGLLYLELSKVKINIKESLIEDNSDIALQVPLTLNKLKLDSCSSSINYEDNFIDSEDVLDSKYYCPFNYISTLKFQNLLSLTITETNSVNDKQLANTYLIDNPNLKSLSLDFDMFNREAFTTLSNSETLNYLSLTKCINNHCFDVNNPNHSVKSLSLDPSIYNTTSLAFIDDLARSFPNINHLKLIYNHKQYKFMERLVQNLYELKFLDLKSISPIVNYRLNIKSRNLYRIQLDNFNIEGLDLKFLTSYKRLKNLKIIKFFNHIPLEISNTKFYDSSLELGWNINFIGTSIVCSKDDPLLQFQD